MNTGKISARYAKALYEFASEKGNEEKVYEAMKCVASAFAQLPNLSEAMINPVVTREKRKELLNAIAGNDVCAEYTRFVDLVVEHKREDYFRSISLVYQDIYRKAKNVVTANVVTAVELTSAEEERFRNVLKQVTDSKVDFEKVVDPDIIGGFVLNVETYQLNASVKSQLNKIADQLKKSNSFTAQ